MTEITSLFIGLKLAIFLAVLALSLLIEMVSNKKEKYAFGLNLMAFCFIIIALLEFLQVMARMHSGMWPWIENLNDLSLITGPLFIIAGVGIIWYFLGIKMSDKAK